MHKGIQVFFVMRFDGRMRWIITVIAIVAICVAGGQTVRQESHSLTTQDRLEDAGWWPTKGDAARSAYAGEAVCQECHSEIAASQQTTPMYHASVRAPQSQILKLNEHLEFQQAGYRYSLSRGVSEVAYSVNDGSNAMTGLVAWAFGAGEIGQTYLLEQQGLYTEGRLSYYRALGGLDITIGQPADAPLETVKALGQRLNHDATRHCFSCHTTASVTSSIFEPEMATSGLSCEACHGPGGAHVAAARAQRYEQAAASIVNPGHLSPSDSVDFCGACHRTWSDVAMLMPKNAGTFNVRFQPYRLEKSRCWGNSGDVRIACIACHDPHQPLVRASASYDSKCLACHLSPRHARMPKAVAPACKVSTSNCVSCHMPKYEVPQAHASFTDHFIRVVHAGEGFPP
jgi:Cytochrome c554 and c-prime